MLRITLSISARCPKHPRYNPSKHGQGAIRGGCLHCNSLWEIYALATRAFSLTRDLQVTRAVLKTPTTKEQQEIVR